MVPSKRDNCTTATPPTATRTQGLGSIFLKRRPEACITRQNIIEVASEEFALNGLSGARIDELAARTRASKRMIYYYFGDKEGLYLAVLENAYRTVREGEAQLDIGGLSPIEALRRLVEFTFDHHHRHEDFIRMVMIENIHHADYLEKSKVSRATTRLADDGLITKTVNAADRRLVSLKLTDKGRTLMAELPELGSLDRRQIAH